MRYSELKHYAIEWNRHRVIWYLSCTIVLAVGTLNTTEAILHAFNAHQWQWAADLLSADNYLVRAQAACAQFWAYYSSATNDAATAIQNGLQAVSLTQATGQATLILAVMSSTAMHMIGTGQLHEAYQLTQQGMQLRTQSAGFVLPAVGWPTLLQADILREWNQLDAALALVEEAISLCKQTASSVSLFFLLCGYAVLLRVHLSRGDLDAARSALQEFEVHPTWR